MLLLVEPGAADVRDHPRGQAGRPRQQRSPLRVLHVLLRPGLAVVRLPAAEQLRVVAGRPVTGYVGEQQRGGGVVGLCPDVVADRGQQPVRRLRVERPDRLRELRHVARHVLVDLGAELVPGLLVDHDEDDPEHRQ
jgi:hypothetical protein